MFTHIVTHVYICVYVCVCVYTMTVCTHVYTIHHHNKSIHYLVPIISEDSVPLVDQLSLFKEHFLLLL